MAAFESPGLQVLSEIAMSQSKFINNVTTSITFSQQRERHLYIEQWQYREAG